jgi:tetratricopeptide (TPR) repeat protein
MKSQSFLFLGFCLALVAFANTACVKENTALVSASPNVVSENAVEADREIDAAQKAIEKAPNSAAGYNKLAVVYIHRARETGDFSLNSKAETAVNRALEIDKDNYDAQKIKASLLLTFHKFQEAFDFGSQLQKEHAQDSFVYGVLTDANVELGNYKEAVDAVQQMVDLRPNMESYARVSYVRSLHGDADGAIEAMNMAARIADPMNKEAQAWCLVHLGDEYFKTGRFAEAEKQYDAALQVFPNYHFAVAGKGHARAANNDYENAVKFFVQAQDRVPLTETVIALGDVYKKLGKNEDARKQYELAGFIEQKLGNTDQRRIALLWADQDMKLDEALEIARREHAARKDIFTADVLAWCLYKKGLFEEAKSAMTEAMRLKTKDARFFYHAGMIEKGLGNKKAAMEFLQKALQTNPAFDVLQAENAKQTLQELKQS